MKLHDTTISKIAQIIQMAILTGTDIIDHLRMLSLELKENEDYIYVAEDYENIFNESIQKMLENAQNLSSKQPENTEEINDWSIKWNILKKRIFYAFN